MFIVVSKWRLLPGAYDIWRDRSDENLRRTLDLPGIVFKYRFLSDKDHVMVCIGYENQETYYELLSEDGQLTRIMEESGIDEWAEFVSAERGELIENLLAVH